MVAREHQVLRDRKGRKKRVEALSVARDTGAAPWEFGSHSHSETIRGLEAQR